MVRITPEQVLEAYTSTGLVPGQGEWIGDSCACGLSVVAINTDPDCKDDLKCGEIEPENIISSVLQLDEEYVSGFTSGFDELAHFNSSWLSEAYDQGYQEGKACWNAVKHLAEVEQ